MRDAGVAADLGGLRACFVLERAALAEARNTLLSATRGRIPWRAVVAFLPLYFCLSVCRTKAASQQYH